MNDLSTKNKIFAAIAILTGATFAILGIAGAPSTAFAILAVAVGALYVLVAIFWPSPTDEP